MSKFNLTIENGLYQGESKTFDMSLKNERHDALVYAEKLERDEEGYVLRADFSQEFNKIDNFDCIYDLVEELELHFQ